MPRIAACGWLMMIGAASRLPLTPWLEMVKVPPRTSAGRQATLARAAHEIIETARGLEQVARLRIAQHRHDEARCPPPRSRCRCASPRRARARCRSSGCWPPAPRGCAATAACTKYAVRVSGTPRRAKASRCRARSASTALRSASNTVVTCGAVCSRLCTMCSAMRRRTARVRHAPHAVAARGGAGLACRRAPPAGTVAARRGACGRRAPAHPPP